MIKTVNAIAYVLAATFLLLIVASYLAPKQETPDYAPKKLTFTSCSNGVCKTEVEYKFLPRV